MKNKTETVLPVKYRDLRTRIIVSIPAAHFINTRREPEDFLEMLTVPEYYPALLGSSVIAFLIFTVINRQSARLDRLQPWARNPWRRLWYQAFYGFLPAMLSSVVLASIYFAYYGYWLHETEFGKHFIFVFAFILGVNVYYNIKGLGLLRHDDTDASVQPVIALADVVPLLHEDREGDSPGTVVQEAGPDCSLLSLTHSPLGKPLRESVIEARQNADFHADSAVFRYLNINRPHLVFSDKVNIYAYVDIVTDTDAEKKKGWSYTLSDSEAALDPDQYFRLCRSYITRRDNIAGIEPRLPEKKLIVELKIPAGLRVDVLGKKAMAEFKEWIM